MLEALKRRLDYARYRRAQVRQSKAKRHKDASFRLEPFVQVIRDYCPDLGPDARILCIGARNEVEVDIFAQHGWRRVTAIDLWSSSPRIAVMDMHALRFPNASFDLIFASHVFEHAWDFDRVARECVRTLRHGGYVFCAFPTNFTVTDHDRYDFRDAAGVLRHFAPWPVAMLYERRRLDEVALLFRVGMPGRVGESAP